MSRIADAFQQLYGGTRPPQLPPAQTTDAEQAPPDPATADWTLDANWGAPCGPRGDETSRDPAEHGNGSRPVVSDGITAWPAVRRGIDHDGALSPVGRRALLPQRELLRYHGVLKRRWRTALAIFAVVVTGVAIGLWLMPPAYRATALLEIRPEGTGSVPVEAMFSSERMPPDDLQTQVGILRSTALAQRAFDRLAAHAAHVTPPVAAAPVKPPVAAAPAKPTVAAVPVVTLPPGIDLSAGGLWKGLMIDPQIGSRLVNVSFQWPDPKIAATVVNAVVDSYVQMRTEDTQRSADWLASQLRDAQQHLLDSESRLHAYVREHGLEVLETGKGEAAQLVNDRLQALHEALTHAQADRIEKQATSEDAHRRASARDLDSPVVQNLTMKLADLRREQARLSSIFQDEYPSVQAIRSQIADVERSLDTEIGFVVSRADREYQAAERRETLLRQALDSENSRVQALGQVGTLTVGYDALKREVVNNQQQVDTLNQKLKEVGISAALKAANVGVVERASPPDATFGPSPLLLLVFAAAAGLALGVGGAFMREYLDTSMRSAVDVDAYLGVPTLAAIPAVPRSAVLPARLSETLSGIADPARPRHDSPLAEAFAALRTAVLLADDGRHSRSILITSARSQEGKTTVSLNLASSLARLQHRVLLVDANMRNPSVERAFALPGGCGLVDHLASEMDWRAGVQRQVRPNLDVLPCGSHHVSPADLLLSPRMQQFVEAALREYAFLVVDSPALLSHPADVQSLARLSDSVLLTVRQGFTPREVVSVALSQLQRVSGVVLNRSGDHGLDDVAAGGA